MKIKTLVRLILVSSCLAGSWSIAYANVPDPNMCSATSADGAFYICPCGEGETLADAGSTITVTVLDAQGFPCVGYPRENIWVGSTVPGELVLCPGANMADTDTDANGVTTISGTIVGGGYTQYWLYVYIDGEPITGSPLRIDVNSPDITGDLYINFCDFILIQEDYFGTYNYHYRSDLNHDSHIGFEDIMVLFSHGGHTCPGGSPPPTFPVSGEIGVFFDPEGTQTGVLGIQSNTPFNFYVVAFNATGGIMAYAFGLTLDPNIEIIGEVTYPAGSTNYSDNGQVHAGTGGECLPEEGSVVLVEYEAILTDQVSEATICLGPATTNLPGEPDSPVYMTYLDDSDWRIFAPAYQGCAMVNGVGPIATTPLTWGAVKTIYHR